MTVSITPTKGGNSPLTKAKLDCYIALKKEDVLKKFFQQTYPGRPNCLKLSPIFGGDYDLHLSEIGHFCGNRLIVHSQNTSGVAGIGHPSFEELFRETFPHAFDDFYADLRWEYENLWH